MLLQTLKTNVEALFGSTMQIFLSARNNQTDAPINKYFSPFIVSHLCLLLLLFLSLFCLVSSFRCMGLDA
jgi:hypothetical protein